MLLLVGGGDFTQEGVCVFAELPGVYRATHAGEGGDVVHEVAAEVVACGGVGEAVAVGGDDAGDVFAVGEDVLGVFFHDAVVECAGSGGDVVEHA